MSDAPLVCRPKPKLGLPPHYTFFALSTFMLIAGIIGAIRNGPMTLAVSLPFSLLLGIMGAIYAGERCRLARSSLEIDPQRRTLTFRHFRFVATFLPEKPRPLQELRFDQVLGLEEFEPQTGISALRIRTDLGVVTVSEHLEHFPEIEETLTQILSTNQSLPDFQARLQTEPKPSTAWYGWLILAVFLAAIIYLGWKTMYAE